MTRELGYVPSGHYTGAATKIVGPLDQQTASLLLFILNRHGGSLRKWWHANFGEITRAPNCQESTSAELEAITEAIKRILALESSLVPSGERGAA